MSQIQENSGRNNGSAGWPIPLGVRCMIYSYLPFSSLISTISKLSTRERNELISTDLIDQPRNLVLSDFSNFNSSAMISNLEYCLKLVRGNVIVKTKPEINKSYEPFVIQMIIYILKQGNCPLCKLSLVINEVPPYVLDFKKDEMQWIDYIKSNLNP